MINLGKISKTGREIILEEQKNGCMKCLSHCSDEDGYTRIKYNGKHERLFRVLYQQKYGQIPKGLVLRHLCNNAWCCNVEHLKPGTYKENAEDMVACGRSQKGKIKPKIRGRNNPSNKLTKKQVREIYLSELGCTSLGRIYNVSKTNIIYIKKKLQWKWFTDKIDKELNKNC